MKLYIQFWANKILWNFLNNLIYPKFLEIPAKLFFHRVVILYWILLFFFLNNRKRAKFCEKVQYMCEYCPVMDNNPSNGSIDRSHWYTQILLVKCDVFIYDTCSMQFIYCNTFIFDVSLLMLVSSHLLSDPYNDLVSSSKYLWTCFCSVRGIFCSIKWHDNIENVVLIDCR